MMTKTYYTNGKNQFNGVFSRKEWSAPYMVSYEEIRNRIDSFRLIGRTIKDIRAIGMSYIHRREDIEECAYNILEGVEEGERSHKSDYDNIDDDMLMNRRLELDEPLLIKFETDDVFEIVTEQAPEYRMSMNNIPWWIEAGINYPNVEASIMLANCIGQKIVDIAVKPKIIGQDEGIEYIGAEPGMEIVSEIILWLSNGEGICISPWLDYCQVCCIKKDASLVKIKVKELKHALYNWEDIHDDESIGFSSHSSNFYFGEKGRDRVEVPYYSVMPEDEISKLRVGEDDFTLFEWALAMINGQLVGIYDDIPEYDYYEWNRVLDEAEKIVSFNSFDELFDYLMTLKDKSTGECELLYYVNRYGADFWKNIDEYKKQLDDMRRWTKLVLPKGKKMIVAGF